MIALKGIVAFGMLCGKPFGSLGLERNQVARFSGDIRKSGNAKVFLRGRGFVVFIDRTDDFVLGFSNSL